MSPSRIILLLIFALCLNSGNSRSTIRFCEPRDCEELTKIVRKVKVEERYPFILYDQCKNYTTVILDRKDHSSRTYEIFKNQTIAYGKRIRSTCRFENQLIRPFFRNISEAIFNSYNLLAAILSSKYLDRSAEIESKRVTNREQYYWLEFGVAKGSSINITSRALQFKFNQLKKPNSFHIYGFDNFTGLPTVWGKYSVGAFSLNGSVPFVEPKVTLVKGLLENTLPPFIQQQQFYSSIPSHDNSHNNEPLINAQKILLGMNIDVDLLEPSKYLLDKLYPMMRPGTLLHFHELYARNKIYDELEALYYFALDHPIQLRMFPLHSNSMEAAVFQVIRTRSSFLQQEETKRRRPKIRRNYGVNSLRSNRREGGNFE
jgi:hypothetical protein